jgi:hypothetical protein
MSDDANVRALVVTLARIEAKLDALASLMSSVYAEDEEAEPPFDLDGNPAGTGRDEGTPL